MLIPFPIGLWVFSLAADVVGRVGGDPVWFTMAYWTMLGGTVGALTAAVPGLVDYLGLQDRAAIRTATVHLTLNLIIVGLFVVNLILRSTGYPADATLPLVLSAIAVGLLLVAGWFGWQLIYGYGVAVSPRSRCARGSGGARRRARQRTGVIGSTGVQGDGISGSPPYVVASVPPK